MVKGRPEFNQLHPTANLQTEEIESFVNPGHLIIDVFGNQTIIIVIRRTAYIWQHNTHLHPEKQGKCHKVLAGNWNTIEFGGPSIGSIITPLCVKCIVDQKSSPFWSMLFISEAEGAQQISNFVMRTNGVKRGLKDKPENTSIVFELEESTKLRTHATSYSPCGRLCVICLNFDSRKSRIYLLHNIDQNACPQPLTTELGFLSENETVKCVEFTHKGSYN